MSELTDRILQYELEELDETETIELFQELINSGIVWALHEHDRKIAQNLLDYGYCTKQ